MVFLPCEPPTLRIRTCFVVCGNLWSIHWLIKVEFCGDLCCTTDFYLSHTRALFPHLLVLVVIFYTWFLNSSGIRFPTWPIPLSRCGSPKLKFSWVRGRGRPRSNRLMSSSSLPIHHGRSCLSWVMTASTLLGPSVTVWILRTVVPGGTGLEELSEWTGRWPWLGTPSNRKENRWHKWWITEPLCRAACLLFSDMSSSPSTTARFFRISTCCTYSIIRTHLQTLHKPCSLLLLYVRHCRINICFQLMDPDSSGTLWCVGQEINWTPRVSLYGTLSRLEIPRPTLVNTPAGLKTSCAGADKHAGPSRLCSERHKGHYLVNAPIDFNPPQSLSKHHACHRERRGGHVCCVGDLDKVMDPTELTGDWYLNADGVTSPIFRLHFCFEIITLWPRRAQECQETSWTRLEPGPYRTPEADTDCDTKTRRDINGYVCNRITLAYIWLDLSLSGGCDHEISDQILHFNFTIKE